MHLSQTIILTNDQPLQITNFLTMFLMPISKVALPLFSIAPMKLWEFWETDRLPTL